MSATITLSSKLPGDEEINGLDSKVNHFLTSEEPVLVVAWVVATKVTRDIASETEVPTVQVRRVEPIGTPDEVPQVIQAMVADLYEKRTGRNPLPIDELLAPHGEVAHWGDEDQEDDVDEDATERPVSSVTDVFGMPDDVDEDEA